MRSMRYVVTLLFLGFASHAEAARYGFCYVDFGKGTDATRYVSGVIDVGGEPQILAAGGSFREAFLDHVRSRYESGASAVACDSWETLNDARRAAFEAGIVGDVIRVRTGWLGGKREAGGGKAAAPRTDSATAAPPASAPKTPPAKPQWEIDYEAKMAVYEQELARQKAAVAEYERAQAELARSREEQAERARKAKEDWEKAVAACKAGDHSKCAQTSAEPQ
ncbi:MAG: hypothetical protein ACLGHC_08715 [Alphaproteobacteria bacterium]